MARSRAQGVSVVLGGDSFLAEEATERLLAGSIGANRQEALEPLRGDECTWARVVEAARSPSLFVPVKAVVVRGADALKGPDEDMRRLLDDPPAGGLLVLVASKPDQRRTIWKRLLAEATVVRADPLKGRALRSYVLEQVRRRGLALSGETVDELIERVGQDLRRLVGELDKLEAFARGGGALRTEDAELVLGRAIAQPAYRLGDAVTARQTSKALELVDELLGEGESAVYLLGVLYRAVRTVRAVRALRAKRLSPEEVATRVGAPPFKGRDLLAWAAKWSPAEVRRGLAAVARADRTLKSGTNGHVALTAAVVAACGSTGARS